jgi:hypothetical protein
MLDMKWMPRIGQQQFEGGMVQLEAPEADTRASRKNAKDTKEFDFLRILRLFAA